MDEKNFWQIVREALILVSIGIAALIILNWTTDIFRTPREKVIEKEIPVISEPKPSEYPDYDAIKGKSPDAEIKAAVITENCPVAGCVNNKPATIDFDGIAKTYQIKGKFARAYLFIEALVDYKRPLTVWDDFYFKIDNIGGHLIPDENILPVPPSDTSRYLYDLRSISYYPSIKDKEQKINKQVNANLFSLLIDGSIVQFTASISSDRAGRVMKEVAIYYECFEGSECSIEEIK